MCILSAVHAVTQYTTSTVNWIRKQVISTDYDVTVAAAVNDLLID